MSEPTTAADCSCVELFGRPDRSCGACTPAPEPVDANQWLRDLANPPAPDTADEANDTEQEQQ